VRIGLFWENGTPFPSRRELAKRRPLGSFAKRDQKPDSKAKLGPK
jgi:hypothetical protein